MTYQVCQKLNENKISSSQLEMQSQ